MSGATVYDQVLKEQIRRGKSPEEAAKRAGEAAATTVQLNTTINTFLNLGAVAPFFSKNNTFRKGAGDQADDLLKITDKGFTEGLKELDGIKHKPKTALDAKKAIG